MKDMGFTRWDNSRYWRED